MKTSACAWGVLCLVAASFGWGAWADAFVVDSNGVLLRDGVPYRGIGVNYVDAFWRHNTNSADTSYVQGFTELAAHGVPFARVAVSPYWASEWQLYRNNRQAYFSRLDDVVRAAESAGVGLIPSLFWTYFTVPDLVGESVNQWGNVNSETIAFMRTYAQEVVTRYKDSPAIWAWEFGNEYMLTADLMYLSNPSQFYPPIVTSLGTPATRSSADLLTTDMILTAYTAFNEVVRQVDSAHLITSGDSMPRSYAEDLRAGNAWAELDTAADYETNLGRIEATGYEIASVHLYPHEIASPRYLPGHLATYDELLATSMAATRALGQALFVGEFGASSVVEGGVAQSVQVNRAMIDAIVANRVPLAAVWVYNFPPQNADGWNLEYTNDRVEVLAAIDEANAAIFADTDGDGLPDIHEDRNANGTHDPNETDPEVADTDGDGVNDGTEVALGRDPLNANDTPNAPLPWAYLLLALAVAAWRTVRRGAAEQGVFRGSPIKPH